MTEAEIQALTVQADQGDLEACSKLGIMYYRGENEEGAPKKYKLAAKFLLSAAQRGDIAAQFHVGLMYEKGLGLPQHYIFAHMWYNIVALNDDDENFGTQRSCRDEIAKKMTLEQVQQAQELAWKCVEKGYEYNLTAPQTPAPN